MDLKKYAYKSELDKIILAASSTTFLMAPIQTFGRSETALLVSVTRYLRARTPLRKCVTSRKQLRDKCSALVEAD